jgi:hypothetical protein
MRALTPAQVLALPAVVDLTTGGQALGRGRTAMYEALHTGELEALGLRVLRLGKSYKIRRCDLLRVLGIEDREPAETPQQLRLVPGGGPDAAA